MTEEVKDAPPEEVKTQAPDKGASDSGTDFVDFQNDPPAKIEARFKRLYGNMKEWERSFQELADHNAKLADRLEKLESTGAQNSQAAEIAKTKAELKQAIEKGETDRQVELSTRLTSLQTKAIDKIEKAPVPQAPNFDVSYVRDWARETDDSGQFRRPWAIEGHPRYAEAFQITREVASTTDDVEEILREVDKRMGGGQKRQPGQATVMSSGGRPPKDKSIQLNDMQKRVADRMGISYDKYAKQLEAMR